MRANTIRRFFALLAVMAIPLACNVQLGDSASPTLDSTRVAMGILLTMQSESTQEPNGVTPASEKASENLAPYGTIIAQVMTPKGGSNLDPEVIRDGEKPPAGTKSSDKNYDTWDGYNQAAEDWIGYSFPHAMTFTSLVFQEGLHFSNGGWFDTIAVQVRKDGVWMPVQSTVSPSYPVGNNGISFEIFAFSFPATEGDAIRVHGAPGGEYDFISVAELEVWGYGLTGNEPVLRRDPAKAAATNTPAVSPTEDMADRMADAKILIFENTLLIGNWVANTLDSMALPYTHVGDRQGDFMSSLNSGEDWDLIIVAAEYRPAIQGEFWGIITDLVNQKKTALIAEVWYLDLYGGGQISGLLAQCGVRVQRDWELAESVYWLMPDDPIFTTPNIAPALIHYNRFWGSQAGDLIKLASGSEAKLLAGVQPGQKSSYGVLASCMGGRVILQTFSNHDFRQSEIMLLWENYITNALTSRFEAIQ